MKLKAFYVAQNKTPKWKIMSVSTNKLSRFLRNTPGGDNGQQGGNGVDCGGKGNTSNPTHPQDGQRCS